MRPTKIVIAILALLLVSESYSQKQALFSQDSGTVKGVMLLSPWRTHTSIDYFMPMEIDTTKSLHENLQKANNDTGFQVSQNTFFYEPSILRQADTLRNEAEKDEIADYIKYVLVLPVEATYHRKTQELFTRNEVDNYIPVQMIFNGHSLLQTINSKTLFLMRHRVLKVRKP